MGKGTKQGLRLTGVLVLAAGGLVTYLLGRREKEKEELEVADAVDLKKYAGDWYEIARFPAYFEKNCYNTKAHYALNENGTLSITNTCNRRNAKGRLRKSTATAYVTDPGRNAKLKLKFFGGLVTGDYEIIEVDDEYRYAMVGTADRKYLWIISRTPALSGVYITDLIKKARSLGFETENLRFTYQEY